MVEQIFPIITDKPTLEDGDIFAPHFDAQGLIVCITIDAHSKALLMVAYMNSESLRLTLESGLAHYWSRSRKALWRKGETSGQTQRVCEMRVDCDQDALLLMVEPGGDGGVCHTGRKSCFYRKLSLDDSTRLIFLED